MAWDEVYEQAARRFPEIQYVTMDAGYKQPWIAKRILEDGRLPILPYTRPHGTRREGFMPWDFSYEEENDRLISPRDKSSDIPPPTKAATDLPQHPEGLPGLSVPKGCGASANGQKVIYRHIWQDAMDAARSRYVKRMSAKACMPCANKPLSVSLPMRKKNTPCVIPTIRLGPCYAMGHA